ncbi:hypothetical protein F2P56_013011 [Juglans regia]|uniref:Reverse transcriptase domain-containing protein n=1 Tax=Juglans regia TaxID=51240 RepID=A0A833XQ78_JUGRE|nr:hypothetical protein F2P56_013011 [Juglans regia]
MEEEPRVEKEHADSMITHEMVSTHGVIERNHAVQFEVDSPTVQLLVMKDKPNRVSLDAGQIALVSEILEMECRTQLTVGNDGELGEEPTGSRSDPKYGDAPGVLARHKSYTSDPEHDQPRCIWNLRGLGSSRNRLKSLVKKNGVHIVGILDPFVDVDKMSRLASMLGLSNFCSNAEVDGKIWNFWSDDCGWEPLSMTNQVIIGSFLFGEEKLLISFNYAKCNSIERRELWQSLEGIDDNEISWIVVGDFNIIREDSERVGGHPRSITAMEEFNICIDHCGLLDLHVVGRKLSWCNGHGGLSLSWARLDRVLTNIHFANRFPQAYFEYLNRKTSDHCPMTISFQKQVVSYGPHPFRFQNMWASHGDFKRCVEEVWKLPTTSVGLCRLAEKLKKTKITLRAWNILVFGHVGQNIKDLEERLEVLESRLQDGYDQDVECDFLVTKLELETWERREEIRISQLVKKKWISEGDNNTKFFHAVVNQRRNSKIISNMRLENGDFLNSPDRFIKVDLAPLIQCSVTEENNLALIMAPSETEILDALKSIPKDSSPGPDGFGLGFYLSCWDLIKEDVVAAAKDFFSGSILPRFYIASYLVLIPKVEDPKNFDKFRPISLYSVAYKIFSKVLVKRMTSMLSQLISHEQGAFIPGRSIFKNITLAQEIIHSLNKKTKVGNIMVKIDMEKAYDRVDWKFLLNVLKSFGFSSQFCNLVKECVQTPWFSIMMNGTYKGFFQPARGLRQGDPLSPYLFIIMEEMLSRLLCKNFEEGRIGCFSHPVGAPIVSHLLYADDLLVFVTGGKQSVLKLMNTLEVYEKWSGQLINKEKSTFFFSKSISTARRRNLKRTTGLVEGNFPLTYLGVPLVSGRLTSRELEPLIEKIRRKIAGWKVNLLSQGGRLTLMKHVLACISTHMLAVLNVPLRVFKKLNSLLSTFFWGELNGRPRMKWISWEKVCKPYKEGGPGMRNFDEVQRSLHMKFAWRLLTVDNLWTKFFRAKFVKHGHIFMAESRRNASRFWKSIMTMFPKVLDNVIVKVREGRSSFWFDRWLASGPLCASRNVGHSKIRINDVWADGSWDENYLLELVGLEKIEEIMNVVGAGKVGSDITIWKPAIKGDFTSASAWDLIRTIGIQLASRCNCCAIGHTESLNHVLCNGSIASAVWRWAAITLGIHHVDGMPWWTTVMHWFSVAKKSSHRGILIGTIPSVITWRLWMRHCKARMENYSESALDVCLAVKVWLQRISSLMVKHWTISARDEAILQALDVHYVDQVKSSPKLVYWRKLNAGLIKLNIGGGGVIRDERGIFIGAFSSCFGHGTNNEAELRALISGLALCKELGFTQISIESDSSLVVSWLSSRKCTAWITRDADRSEVEDTGLEAQDDDRDENFYILTGRDCMQIERKNAFNKNHLLPFFRLLHLIGFCKAPGVDAVLTSVGIGYDGVVEARNSAPISSGSDGNVAKELNKRHFADVVGSNP